MSELTRRDFLRSSLGAVAGMTVLSGLVACSNNNVPGANDEIHVGVIGFNSKGAQHINSFHELENVRVTALCDVDSDVLSREAQKFKDRGEQVETYIDARNLLENRDIDAVAIATPNHWHSLLTIWAVQAGKDVYVEKPVSHNIWEGRKMVEAANQYNRIVQAGTQNRSDVGLRAAVEYIKEGNIGAIQWARGLWYKRRGSIGFVNEPQPVPESIDYNLWTGPKSILPLMRENLHYDWHWIWEYGNGDMGNLGIHQIDDCRFALGLEGMPERVMMIGGRFGVDDNAETPNTQMAVFDYAGTPVVIEVRNLPMKAGTNAMDAYRGVRAGNIIQCEDGYFAGGRGGGWIYDNNGERVKLFEGDGGGGHQANFIEAMRSRNTDDLYAPIEQGHYSTALCHAANISYYLGNQVTDTSGVMESVAGISEAEETVESLTQHLQANEISLDEQPLIHGPWLSINKEQEEFTGDGAKEANPFLRGSYRYPFIVPERV